MADGSRRLAPIVAEVANADRFIRSGESDDTLVVLVEIEREGLNPGREGCEEDLGGRASRQASIMQREMARTRARADQVGYMRGE